MIETEYNVKCNVPYESKELAEQARNAFLEEVNALRENYKISGLYVNCFTLEKTESDAVHGYTEAAFGSQGNGEIMMDRWIEALNGTGYALCVKLWEPEK